MALASAAADLTGAILPGLRLRWAGDAAFRQRWDRYLREVLGWQSAGANGAKERTDTVERLAGLAALAMLAQSIIDSPRRGKAKGSVSPFVSDDPLAGLALELTDDPERHLASLNGKASQVDEFGPLYEALVPARDRQSRGQFYSDAGPIDLVLGFTLRRANEEVLDPACGSGAFLVRALYRLAELSRASGGAGRQSSGILADLAKQLHGVDNDPVALRFAASNLAAITGFRGDLRLADFFSLKKEALPGIGAVAGNPPYTRQELLGTPSAKDASSLTGGKSAAWTAASDGFEGTICRRAGLYVPYLMHACSFLPPEGRLGVLTSNAWLNADYGRALRRFILDRCRIVAVIAPSGERWFGAAVHALILIAKREDDPKARRRHVVRFVRLKRPLASLIGDDPWSPERWRKVDQLVARIEATAEPREDDDLHVLPVAQGQLECGGGWDEKSGGAEGRGLTADRRNERRTISHGPTPLNSEKWAVYLKAPKCYFYLVRDAGDRFCPLGELVSVRRGLTTGANDFFYVREVPERGEAEEDVATVIAGDGSRHLIEKRYLAPVVTSPRELPGLVVPDHWQLAERVVLLPRARQALAGMRALEYVLWGEREGGIASRRTCQDRAAWWSLTPAAAGPLLWCKTHYTRHFAPRNPAGVLVDCNLYQLTPRAGVAVDLLAAVLNSSLVALTKELYGRANLGEGALKTEVSDLRAMLVPDPRQFAAADRLRVIEAYTILEQLPVRDLRVDLRRPERRQLDGAVLTALGWGDSRERWRLLDELYAAIGSLLSERVEAARPKRAADLARQLDTLENVSL